MLSVRLTGGEFKASCCAFLLSLASLYTLFRRVDRGIPYITAARRVPSLPACMSLRAACSSSSVYVLLAGGPPLRRGMGGLDGGASLLKGLDIPFEALLVTLSLDFRFCECLMLAMFEGLELLLEVDPCEVALLSGEDRFKLRSRG